MWESHLRNGFFGWTPSGNPKESAQPRFLEGDDYAPGFDIIQALEDVGHLLSLFAIQRSHPGVPLFAGGLLDDWPACAVDGLPICRSEYAVIEAHVANEQQRGQSHG